MSQRRRRGFSLIDLLVLAAILGLLLAFLLPAVAKVRMAAQRTQSANNLKQLALACHNYLDTNASFPPGNDGNNFSATTYLLPYIEQDNLFKQIDLTKAMTDDANAATRKVPIKMLLSPEDPRASVSDDYGATNYLFCAGTKPVLADNDGVFYQDSKTGIATITDGTSNTLLAGETLKGDGATKATDVRRQHVVFKDKKELDNLTDDSGVKDFADNKNIAGDRCASWMDGRYLQGTFSASRAMNESKPDVSCAGAGGLAGLRSLSSRTNVALCDGSVHSINSKVTVDIWKLLAGKSDGQVLPGDVFDQ